jgi:hypothetical protein
MNEDHNSLSWQGRHLRRFAAFIPPGRRVTDSAIGGSSTYSRDSEDGAHSFFFYLNIKKTQNGYW